MSIGNFLRSALPVAAGIFGSPIAGALVGGAMGAWGQRNQARGMERAGQQAQQGAMGGFNWLSGSPIGQQYLPAGGAAMAQQQALLGLGGDTQGAQAAYDNYLNSIGHQNQLAAGSQAITGNRAARGLLGSGGTATALQEHGQQLGRESFGNYLGHLSGVAGMGLQAGGMMGQAAQQGSMMGAGMGFQAGMGAAGARGRGWDQLMGGLGGAYNAWGAGRANQPQAQPSFMSAQGAFGGGR